MIYILTQDGKAIVNLSTSSTVQIHQLSENRTTVDVWHGEVNVRIATVPTEELAAAFIGCLFNNMTGWAANETVCLRADGIIAQMERSRIQEDAD